MTESPLADVQLRLVDSIDEAMELKRWMGERHEGLMCVDTESGGLSPWRDRLRMVQVGDMHTGWAIPWERWGGVALEVLNAWDGDLGAHNSVYDWQVLSVRAGHDLAWDRTHCTLTQARIDDPSRPNGLKPRAAADIDRRAIAGEKALHEGMAANKWTWDTVPWNYPPYWIYSALDPVLTSHLDNKYRPRVMASAPEAYALERAANRICTKMMMKGMLVDVPYVRAAITKFAKTSEEIRAWLTKAHQITSPVSPGEIRRAFERLGQEILFWTDNTGQPQFTKETLGWYWAEGQNAAVRQLAQYILAVRKADKMPRDYLQKFLDLRDSDDILRMSINVMGAITSRMSVSTPPMQQLSRDEKMIRGSFIPRPGHVFISCDLDQIEMRMIADASGDEGLISAILEADATGGNLFLVIGREMYGEKITKADPRYTALKAFCYARAYGAGHDTLASTAGVPIAQILHIEELFDSRFPGMRTLMAELEQEAGRMRARGERAGVAFPSGRIIPCKPGKDYTMLNYKIQCAAAEYLKKTLVNIDSCGYGDDLVLPIHDEALLEVPIAQAEEALHVVEECMTDRTSYRVPLTAGGAILSERWAKA